MTLAHLRNCLLLGAVALAALAGTPTQAALTISNGATKNVSCSNGVCQATSKNAVLNASDLETMLASADVTVQSKSKAKDIELKVALSFASASRLTLDAYQSITFDKPLTVAGSGALTLTTNDGGTGGELSFISPGRVAFWDLSSSLVIDGATYTLVGDIATLASDIAADPAGHYALANNYDASVDGTYASSPIPTTLSGTFEGLGNTISRLTINHASGHDNIGLFASTDSSAIIDSINLKALQLTTRGTSAQSIAGGLVAVNNGMIRAAAILSGSVTDNRSSTSYLGGLVGRNFGTIESSAANVKVRADKGPSDGGLAGGNDGMIESSRATGPVSNGWGGDVGGLVGANIGHSVIDGCLASGAVTGNAGNSATGGLAGFNGTTISNSYATGSAVGEYAGGLVGIGSGLPISSSYSTGAPSGSGDVGGLVGFDNTQPGNQDTYWDLDTSGISDPSQGAGNVANDPKPS